MRKIFLLLVLMVSLLLVTSCSGKYGPKEKVTIILEDGREIKLELYPEVAPISVANFLKLVDSKYYDGVIFHRVIEGFMIQTGGYYVVNGKIFENPSVPTIKGEFSANGVENKLKHKAGVISMARTNDMDSATGQFFICSDDCSELDGQYAAFGRVRDNKSLKVVKEISKVITRNYSTEFADLPYDMIIIKTIVRG